MSSRVGWRRNRLCSYVYDAETQLYYLQSRYYDPELGRFINADAFASTGQGILGNNMYAYCNNNPVSRKDCGGYVSEVVIAGIAAAVISGISNAVVTACSGGTIEESLIAGLAGTVGGAVGFVVAVATDFSPMGNVAARTTTTIVSNFGTNLLLNGKITAKDVAFTVLDATFDVCLSQIVYFYNPLDALVPQTATNALADGIIDNIENELLYKPQPKKMGDKNTQKLTFMERRLTN